jgi:hypothetical protein
VKSGTSRIERRRIISESADWKRLREEYSQLFALSLLRRLSLTVVEVK